MTRTIIEIQAEITKYESIKSSCFDDYLRICNTHVYSVQGKQQAINEAWDYCRMYSNALKEVHIELANAIAISSTPAANRFTQSSFMLSLIWVAKFYSALFNTYTDKHTTARCTACEYWYQAKNAVSRAFTGSYYSAAWRYPNIDKYITF